MFGAWINDVSILHDKYTNAKPFPHVLIPNFFTEEYANEIFNIFPDPDDTWFKYDNPFEGKYLFNTFTNEEPIKNAIDSLYTPEFIRTISSITGISELESDPHLNAGGLHAYPRNGLSGVHLDYTIHPKTGKERRVSIVVYLNKGWSEEWGGNLNIWDDKLKTKTVLEHDLWNTAVIFKTNGTTYHGIPDPIKCPDGTFRKSIGIYYMSEPSEFLESYRKNAIYFPTPGAPVTDKMKKLYDIRKNRRLTPEDLLDWPTWRSDCGREN
jgi:hypothetical protein